MGRVHGALRRTMSLLRSCVKSLRSVGTLRLNASRFCTSVEGIIEAVPVEEAVPVVESVPVVEGGLDIPDAHKFPEVPSLRRQWWPQSPDPEILSTKLAVMLNVGELGLSKTEKKFVEALAGARCSKWVLKLVSRIDSTYEENEAKLASQFGLLIEESKKLAVEYPGGLKDMK